MSSLRSFDPDDRSQTFVDGPAAELLRAWHEGRQPDLEAFVAGFPDLSVDGLSELVRLDLDVRWLQKDPRGAESYLARFPALADNAELAVDVIYAEYLARERAGRTSRRRRISTAVCIVRRGARGANPAALRARAR